MNSFLENSENFLNGNNNGYSQDIQTEIRQKIIDGRMILYKYKCPLCGSKNCRVRKTSKEGYPVLYCKTHKKEVECIYKYI